jgi:hypothetical protein
VRKTSLESLAPDADKNALAQADELLGKALELFFAARDALGAGIETD